MDTLLLDQTTWDLTLDADGNIALASDPYSVAQDVASAIRLFAGELWYNTAKGVPYLARILGRFPPISLMKAEFEKAALTVPGVVGAQCAITALRNRTVTGTVTIEFSTTTVTTAGGGAVTARSVITFVGDNGGILTFIGDNGSVITFVGLG